MKKLLFNSDCWRPLAIAVSLLVASLAHAGTAGRIMVFNGADPNTAPQLTDGQPTMVDFGETSVGATLTREFAIRNDPTAAGILHIYGLTLPAGFSRMDTRTFPFDLAAGDSYVFEIRFNAASEGEFNGTLSIQHSGGISPPFDFPIRAGASALTITCSSNITVECTGGLTPVTYSVTASNLMGPVAVTCVPPSGTGFRMGTSNVVCTASGTTNSCSFTVTVRDTTPPTLTCNPDVFVQATNAAGRVVNYTAGAFDACGIGSFNCLPIPGSIFPIGVTTVTCKATDAAGNSNSCSFAVTVLNCPLTFRAVLNGAQQVPPSASPGTGLGTVVLSADETTITVNENWSGLIAQATGSRIHGPAGPGTIATWIFSFTGVPSSSAGAIPTQSFAITPGQVDQLKAGLFYMQVHSPAFPSGEIRGQLLLDPNCCELPSGPVDQTVCAGSDVTFCTVVTNANVIAYQWCKGTTELPGQTNDCLALFNATPADAGEYCVKVTTACFTVTNCAALTVRAPVATTPLTSFTGQCGGDSVTFQTTVTGGYVAGPPKTNISFFTDFSPGAPAGSALYGAAAVGDVGSNNVLRLIDAGGGEFGSFLLADPAGGANVTTLHAHWRSLVGGGSGADGYSFNWANNLPVPATYENPGEEGWSSGLCATVDTYANSDEDVGIEIKWQGSRVAFTSVPADPSPGAFLRRNQFVEADLTVNVNGEVVFNYDGVAITATLPGFAGIARGGFMFAARRGEKDDNHWIDDVRLEIGAVPPCPLTLAWFKNGGLISGQTNDSLTLTNLSLADAGQYCVVASGCCNSVSNCATLTLENVPPLITCSSNLTVELPPGSNSVPVNFTVAVSDNCGGPPETFYLDNFDSTNSGFTVETPEAFDSPWAYSLGAGSWQVVQDGAEVGHPMTTSLTSPTQTVTHTGPVLLKFAHRYSFEYDSVNWDGGQVQVSVNGGPFTAVPAAAFTMNGYNGTVVGNSASVLRGQMGFVQESPGHQTPAFLTSVAGLGLFNPGDKVVIRFLYAGDTNTRGNNVPSWEITSIALAQSPSGSATTAVCAPPSGSAFSQGVTTVTCVATDAASNANACSFTVAVSPACLLVWKFDEASGLVALDSSGNNNLGRLTNGPVRTNGVVGRALWFDGSNDRVQASNSTSLNVTGAFTVACWVRPESLSEYRYFLVKGNDANEKLAYGLRSYNSKLEYRWVSPAGIQSAIRSTTNVLAAGRWTHVAAAHAPGSAPMLFVNGVAVPASVIEGSASNLIGTSPNPFCVGASADNVDKFKGTIDEVFVCLTKLTAGQIRNLTNGLPPGPVPPPPAVGIVTASPLPAGVIGAAYSTTLTATGGTPGFTWSIISNSLPAGLTLNTNTGVISGTPTAAGTDTFRVRVRDTAAQTSEKNFTLGIANRPACLVVYKFEEASGMTALDSSGNGINGTLLNGPIRTNGQVNRALRFDGSNDRVNGGNPSSLNHTGAITLAAWVRPESLSGTRMVIIKGELDDEDYAWALGTADAKLQYRWVNTSGNEAIYQSAPSVLTVGRWMHIAAVHTPGSIPRLYTNGVLVAGSITTGSGVANIGTTSKPFTVGSSSDGDDRFLGIIDEVFVCRGGWSTAGLSNLMAGLPPDFVPTATPVAPFPLPALPSATPFLVTLRASESIAAISWAAVPGLSYRVQFKTGLEEKEWQDLPGDVYAFDEIASIEDNISEQPQRFYRVVTIP